MLGCDMHVTLGSDWGRSRAGLGACGILHHLCASFFSSRNCCLYVEAPDPDVLAPLNGETRLNARENWVRPATRRHLHSPLCSF